MIFFITTLVVINACSDESKRDLLVVEYEGSTIKSTNQINIIYSEEVGFITGQDSLNYYFNKYKHAYPSNFATVDSFISYQKNALLKNALLIKEYASEMEIVDMSNKSLNFFYKDMIRILEDSQFKRQAELNNLLAFSRKNDEIFLKKVKYTITIDDPNVLLSEKEITSLYFFTLDESEIVSKVYLFESYPKKTTLFNFY